jgi:hypothetical protein
MHALTRRTLALAGGIIALTVAGLAAQTTPFPVLGSVDANDTFSVTADESIAAGPASLIYAANSFISIRRKSGDLVVTAFLSDLFRSVLARGEDSVFDPRVLYDESSGRFFLIATGNDCISSGCSSQSDTGRASHYFLAVSKLSTPASLGAGDWYTFALDATLDNATRTGRWADFPSLGVSDDAVIITSQMFPFGEVATSTNKTLKIRVLSKKPLLGGGVPPWVDFTNITDPSNGALLKRAIQPAHQLSSANTAFVVGLPNSGCNVVVFGIQNAATAPVLTSRAAQSSVLCPEPPKAQQPGGASTPLASFGSLRTPPVYRNASLWVAQGVGKTLASGTVSGFRLSQIDVSQWPEAVSMVQDAVFADDGAGLHYPTLTVDSSSNVGLIFGRSSATEYLSLYATGRLGSDPLNTIRSAVPFKPGNGLVIGGLLDSSLGALRFADYFGAALDPSDGTVWVVGEYGRASVPTPGLGRSIGHVAFPPDPSPPPKLTLTLNASAFATRDSMMLTATMSPGARSGLVDAYVVVRAPGGQPFSLRLDGSVVAGVVPIATRFAPFRFTGDLARIAFTSAIPAGRYTWQAYLTEPGTTTVVGVVNETSFTFGL